jgi:tetratricopeptide (TPR) repeat protein
MNTSKSMRLLPLAAAILISACNNGGAPDTTPKTGVDGTYLFVSSPELYYGARSVGSSSEAVLELQNRGGDRYPLESIRVSGNNPDAFVSPILGDIVLEPAQALRIPIAFEPLSEGRKTATFEIDYKTIQLVDESVNQQEQAYYEASDLAEDGQYRASAERYNDYIDSDPVTINKRRAAIRIPVVQEADVYGDGRDSNLYMDALASRDRSDPEDALHALDTLLLLESDSFLADDAQYLKGYIALMDLNNPQLALREFQILTDSHPDSTYYDTAQYGAALSQQQLGNDKLAYVLLQELKSRHTGVSALGVDLPKDDLVSRLWFARASEALENLESASA